ncbi:MAG: hypothetical protein QNM02_17985 [Acidimicrobiia bacterium]|nr:hypothetical protein [Acidimicrobiia bacterium]
MLAGVLGAAALWSAAEGRQDGTIADFARAPAGCDTTLTFEESGRFLIYVETAGRVDDVAGDCDVEGAFVRRGDAMPPFELVVIDTEGGQLAIGSHPGVAYDSDGFVGSSIGALEIDGPGDYVMRVASPADDFVVAVGIDPDDDAAMLRLGALSVLIGGLVVGGTAVVLAARRGREPEVVGAVWTVDQRTTTPEPPMSVRPIVPGEALHPPSDSDRATAAPWRAPDQPDM